MQNTQVLKKWKYLINTDSIYINKYKREKKWRHERHVKNEGISKIKARKPRKKWGHVRHVKNEGK